MLCLIAIDLIKAGIKTKAVTALLNFFFHLLYNKRNLGKHLPLNLNLEYMIKIKKVLGPTPMALRKAGVANMHILIVFWQPHVFRRYHSIYSLRRHFLKWAITNYYIISKVLRLFFGFLKPIIIIIIYIIIIMTFIINAFFFPLK